MTMHDKICLVTGANTGIGRATATGLARAGATVVLACRDPQKGAEAGQCIVSAVPNAAVHSLTLDLSSLASVRTCAAEFTERFPRLDVLINNAGIMAASYHRTADGNDRQFSVNHLGPFLLTLLLLPLLKKSAPSRIIMVASALYQGSHLDFDDLQGEKHYASSQMYGRSKLANILFTRSLAKRLRGSGVTINALHPGVVATDLMRQLPAPVRALSKLFLASPQQGAATSLYLATSPEVAHISGEYFEKSRVKPLRANASDERAAERLWDISAKLTHAPV